MLRRRAVAPVNVDAAVAKEPPIFCCLKDPGLCKRVWGPASLLVIFYLHWCSILKQSCLATFFWLMDDSACTLANLWLLLFFWTVCELSLMLAPMLTSEKSHCLCTCGFIIIKWNKGVCPFSLKRIWFFSWSITLKWDLCMKGMWKMVTWESAYMTGVHYIGRVFFSFTLLMLQWKVHLWCLIEHAKSITSCSCAWNMPKYIIFATIFFLFWSTF